MKPAVNTLTEDQAVGELAALLDSAPPEDQVLEFAVWKRDNSARAQQLEAHIIHLQNLVKKEDAPPQHLQPEPKEKAMVTKKKTPTERLNSLVGKYEAARIKVLADPAAQKLRNAANVVKSHIKAYTSEFKLTMPQLEPLPQLPDPKSPVVHAMDTESLKKMLRRNVPTPKAPNPGAPAPKAETVLSFQLFRGADGALLGSLDWNQKELSNRMATAFLQDLMDRLEQQAG